MRSKRSLRVESLVRLSTVVLVVPAVVYLCGIETRSDRALMAELSAQRTARLAYVVEHQADLSSFRRCLLTEGNVLPVNFVYAVAAVESYNRPPFRRFVENSVARIVLKTTGQLPEMSL